MTVRERTRIGTLTDISVLFRLIVTYRVPMKVKTAVIFGADAVYIGGEAFGLRAKAKNFSKEDIELFMELHITLKLLSLSEIFFLV
mgnify:CR=1 FL=1